MPPHARMKSPGVLSAGGARRVIARRPGRACPPRGRPRAPRGCARFADRRRALELGRAVGDLLGGERQVVRARFGGDRRRRPRLRGREIVERVAPTTGARCATRAPNSARQRDHQCDRLDLRGRRAGGEIGRVGGSGSGALLGSQDRRRKLGVDEQRERRLRPAMRHQRGAQIALRRRAGIRRRRTAPGST